MIIDRCEECNVELDEDNTMGVCPQCDSDLREAEKDREFDEKKALGYL